MSDKHTVPTLLLRFTFKIILCSQCSGSIILISQLWCYCCWLFGTTTARNSVTYVHIHRKYVNYVLPILRISLVPGIFPWLVKATYFVFILEINSRDESPFWEATGFPESQEIPGTLWNSNVHYRISRDCRFSLSRNILNISSNIIHAIRWRKMRWVGHVLSYEAMRNAYNVQLKKTESQRPIWKHRRRCDENIKIDSKGMRRDVEIGDQLDPHRF